MLGQDLEPGEPHPATFLAKDWLIEFLSVNDINLVMDALTDSSQAGSRMAEICSTTLYSLMNGVTVEDRYLLGLAWMLRDMANGNLKVQAEEKPNG